MQLGTTFTPHIIREFNLEVMSAFKAVIDLGFDFLRLGTYWSEIEKEQGKYDFSNLKEMLDLCQERKQKVVLTLGMKAPRWPEFYFPSYLKNKNPRDKEVQKACLKFLRETIKFSQKYDCISHFQLENEALDPSGPENRIVPLDLLKKELELIKNIDSKRPVIFSAWGNKLSQRNAFSNLAPLADIIGLDLYYQQFVAKVLGKSIYKGPGDSDAKIAKILKESGKEAWIMELQAEPWEASREEYLVANPRSISPRKIKEFFTRAKKLPVKAIFFWGFEYAYYQAKKCTNPLYLEAISKCIMKNNEEK